MHRFSPLFVIHLISLRRLKHFNEHTRAPVNALHLLSHDTKKSKLSPLLPQLFSRPLRAHTHTHTRALHGPLRSPNRHGPSLFSSHQVKSGRLMILITCEPLFSIHQQLRAFALSFFKNCRSFHCAVSFPPCPALYHFASAWFCTFFHVSRIPALISQAGLTTSRPTPSLRSRVRIYGVTTINTITPHTNTTPSTFSRALIKIVTSRPKSIKVFLATVRNIILAPFSIMPVSLDATRLAFLTRAHRHIAPTRLAFYTRTLRHVARAYLAFYRRTHRYVVRAHLALYRSTQRHVARAHLAFYRRTHMLRAYTRFFHWFHSYLTEESLSVASPYRSIL